MMTLTQFVLSKIAEEATELAKEALKGQQQGLFSTHRGKANYQYIQDEYIDLIARSTLLNRCSDIRAKKGDKFDLLVGRYAIDRTISVRMEQSLDKMGYWIYKAYENGQVSLDETELGVIILYHNSYLQIVNQEKANGTWFHD